MEAMGLAIMTELPLVIVNSQRGGPSTGLPTKTEQSISTRPSMAATVTRRCR
jgi:pyruvate/2-oxoacid:ferredoxin oxidoreductase alpha subunit